MAKERTICLRITSDEPDRPIVILPMRDARPPLSRVPLENAVLLGVSDEVVAVIGEQGMASSVLGRHDWLALGSLELKLAGASQRKSETLLGAGSWASPELVVFGRVDRGGSPIRHALGQKRDAVTVVGRSGGADIVVDDPDMSRRHFRLTAKDGGHWIDDAGSTHGTFVGDVRVVSPRLLANGDRIRAGGTRFEYVSYFDLLRGPGSDAVDDIPKFSPKPAAPHSLPADSSSAPSPFAAATRFLRRARAGLPLEWIAAGGLVASTIVAMLWLFFRFGRL